MLHNAHPIEKNREDGELVYYKRRARGCELSDGAGRDRRRPRFFQGEDLREFPEARYGLPPDNTGTAYSAKVGASRGHIRTDSDRSVSHRGRCTPPQRTG